MGSPFPRDVAATNGSAAEGAAAGRIKRGRASLIGGVVTGACVLVLWIGAAASLGLGGTVATVSGIMAGGAVAAWVRLADL
ncbi:MAG: hypothetical protein KGL52_17670 [Rhodospirillales bacterium]|jgi:hypothetical protein|nr:hypothetical protein [Rhodospirillales bacterium]